MHQPTKRHVARIIARTGAIGSAVMLLLTAWGLSMSGVPTASAAVVAGTATVIHPLDGSPDAGDPLSSGGSATPFSLNLPAGAACLGDSATDGYRVQTYVVPSSIAPSALTFDAAGPVPGGVGASFRQPLYDAVTTGAYVDGLTLANPGTPRPRPGEVINLPGFSFGVFEPGNLPAGTYNVGIACTLGSASATQLDRFWNVQLAVVADAGDEPAGLAWSVAEPGPTTTTTSGSTTTTAGGSTTTTTAEGGSTTTTDGTTTTTEVGQTTSTTLFPSGGAPTGGGTPLVEGVTTLPVTGGSTMSLFVWSVLLVIFGRMAVLLGRPPRVRPAVA
ncbi:MAG: hypothetical protein ABL966_03265 [Acidimicrobiales bacterium]